MILSPMENIHSIHLLISLLLVGRTYYVLADENPYCYKNNYSSPFDNFSFYTLNKQFQIEEGDLYYGCVVLIHIDYQLRVIRLEYMPTKNYDTSKDEHTLLKKNKVIIQVEILKLIELNIFLFFQDHYQYVYE